MATPRSFSQPPASFIASEHLGIHHTPLVAYLPLYLERPLLPQGRSPRGIVETRDQGPGPGSSPRTLVILRRLSEVGASRRRLQIELSQQKLNSTLRMQFSKNGCGADRVRTDDIQLAKLALSQLSYSPRKPVGLGGLEPPTSRLSGARSSQLSYRPGRSMSRTARSLALHHILTFSSKSEQCWARPFKTRQQVQCDCVC